MKTMLALFLLSLLTLGSTNVKCAELQISEEDVSALREWNTQDPALFQQLFVGVHQGILDLGKLPEEQSTRLGAWQRERPVLFMRLYSVAWPEAIQSVSPPRRAALIDEVPTYSI